MRSHKQVICVSLGYHRHYCSVWVLSQKLTLNSLESACTDLIVLHWSLMNWSRCCKDVVRQRDHQNSSLYPAPLSKAIPHCPNYSWLSHQAATHPITYTSWGLGGFTSDGDGNFLEPRLPLHPCPQVLGCRGSRGGPKGEQVS